jgi:nucleotide-binding universal stress UspA family protein
MIPKKTSSIQLKTQVIISPISVTGNIVEYADREKIDLIVIGTRGRSTFKRILLGSTASGGRDSCTLSCNGSKVKKLFDMA